VKLGNDSNNKIEVMQKVLTTLSLLWILSCNTTTSNQRALEMTDEIFNKKVVVILSKELDPNSHAIDIQDYIQNGKSFIPVFTSRDKFNESSKGAIKNPTIEIDGMLFLSFLKGNEELRLDPDLDDEIVINAAELIKRYEADIKEVKLNLQQLKKQSSDVERLLDQTFPFIEDLLKQHGEFYPLACAVKSNDSIVNAGAFDGNDRPLSAQVTADLKTGFRTHKDDYKTIAVFYMVGVVNPNTKLKTDAVAVDVESKSETESYTFYYPNVLTTDRQLSFQRSWKSTRGREVFND